MILLLIDTPRNPLMGAVGRSPTFLQEFSPEIRTSVETSLPLPVEPPVTKYTWQWIRHIYLSCPVWSLTIPLPVQHLSLTLTLLVPYPSLTRPLPVPSITTPSPLYYPFFTPLNPIEIRLVTILLSSLT